MSNANKFLVLKAAFTSNMEQEPFDLTECIGGGGGQKASISHFSYSELRHSFGNLKNITEVKNILWPCIEVFSNFGLSKFSPYFNCAHQFLLKA